MKKVLLLCGAMLALTATLASAQGLTLNWTNCFTDTPAPNKNFACTSNSGSNVIVGTYAPDVEVPTMSGNEIVVDLQSSGSTLPAWWQFKNASTCRTTSLAASFNAPGTAANCADAWSGQASGGIGAYNIGIGGNPSRARIVMAVAIPAPNTLDIPAGQDTYSFTLTVNNQKTVGATGCAGCSTPVCIVLNSIKLTQPVGVGDVLVSQSAGTNYVTWQGGAIGGGGCPAATPTHNTTWGAVKSLYR